MTWEKEQCRDELWLVVTKLWEGIHKFHSCAEKTRSKQHLKPF